MINDHDNELTTAAIGAVFTEEIAALGGTVTEIFDDGARLFARSVLPRTREVVPGDRVQDGIALRATDREVWVHPYVFRQVCSNGAIMAHAGQSWQIDDIELLGPEHALSELREAVRACGEEAVFAAATQEMRSATQSQADLALNLMPMLSRLNHADAVRYASEILGRFFKDGDSSRFGLMNAVTSVARDTRDPEKRWRLEEIGGAILAGLPPTPSRDGARVKQAGRLVASGA